MNDDNDPINLTRRETLQIQEMIENPPPRNAHFTSLKKRYQAHNTDCTNTSVPWTPTDKAKAWIDQNLESIESSNPYVEEHGLPLEKGRATVAGINAKLDRVTWMVAVLMVLYFLKLF